MAYTRTTWENREVEKPRTYTQTTNADGTITLTPAEGQIYTAGTPVNAINMNKIEDQLVVTDNHHANKANPHSVTAAQVGAYTKTEADGRFEPIDSAYTKAEADARFEPIDSAYTKAESDGRYEYKIGTRNNAFLYTDAFKSYPATTWNNIYFPKWKNVSSGMNSLMGYGVSMPTSGYHSINLSFGLGNIGQTAGYVLLDLKIGTSSYRIAGQHYDMSGNVNIGGSVVDYIAAGTEVRAYLYCNAAFDIVGTLDEYRTFMSIRQLV